MTPLLRIIILALIVLFIAVGGSILFFKTTFAARESLKAFKKSDVTKKAFKNLLWILTPLFILIFALGLYSTLIEHQKFAGVFYLIMVVTVPHVISFFIATLLLLRLLGEGKGNAFSVIFSNFMFIFISFIGAFLVHSIVPSFEGANEWVIIPYFMFGVVAFLIYLFRSILISRKYLLSKTMHT